MFVSSHKFGLPFFQFAVIVLSLSECCRAKDLHYSLYTPLCLHSIWGYKIFSTPPGTVARSWHDFPAGCTISLVKNGLISQNFFVNSFVRECILLKKCWRKNFCIFFLFFLRDICHLATASLFFFCQHCICGP